MPNQSHTVAPPSLNAQLTAFLKSPELEAALHHHLQCNTSGRFTYWGAFYWEHGYNYVALLGTGDDDEWSIITECLDRSGSLEKRIYHPPTVGKPITMPAESISSLVRWSSTTKVDARLLQNGPRILNSGIIITALAKSLNAEGKPTLITRIFVGTREGLRPQATVIFAPEDTLAISRREYLVGEFLWINLRRDIEHHHSHISKHRSTAQSYSWTQVLFPNRRVGIRDCVQATVTSSVDKRMWKITTEQGLLAEVKIDASARDFVSVTSEALVAAMKASVKLESTVHIVRGTAQQTKIKLSSSIVTGEDGPGTSKEERHRYRLHTYKLVISSGEILPMTFSGSLMREDTLLL